MTSDEIDKLDQRELDAQVAERVFGWPPSTPEAVLHYSTDPAAMMEVVGRMKSLDFHVLIQESAGPDEWDVYFCMGENGDAEGSATAPTLPLAVARAALKAVEGRR